MKYVKMLGLAAVAVAAVMAFVGASSASATVLCKTNTTPCGSKYAAGTQLKFVLNTGTKAVLKAGFAVIECEGSEIAGEVTNAGGAGVEVSGNISTLAFSKCNCTVETVSSGKLSAEWISGSMNAKLKAKEFKVKVTCGEIKPCVFGGEVKENLTATGGSPATEEAAEAPIPKVEGPATCNNPSKWTAKYTASGTNTAIWAADS